MATADFQTDVIVVGFGAAGGCAAIEAHAAGAGVLVLEKQVEQRHFSNTRMSGGGFHCPQPGGDLDSIKAYAQAMFSGENLPHKLEGEQPEFSAELARLWAEQAPHNAAFMQGLDPQFKTVVTGGAAFDQFPGAAASKYAVVRSTYTGAYEEDGRFTKDEAKSEKQAGEAFHACLLNGLKTRGIEIHYDTAAERLLVNAEGEVVGVAGQRDGKPVVYHARRGVVLTCGGYEYNVRMRKAFLDGPGIDGWAFYGSPANTGDGIRMALRIGAALSRISSVAARVICAIPERRHGIRIGMNTTGTGKPNEIVVDNYGMRYGSERRITKDPSRYIYWKDALRFDTSTLEYPRIPSWMVFDQTLFERGAVVRVATAKYLGVDWGEDNQAALRSGWILKGDTLEALAEKIRVHPENGGRMDGAHLARTVARFNAHCVEGRDADFAREPATLGPIERAPFYAVPLYPGGPNTKGGLRANPRREVLDWDDRPIPRLYTAGEISSVFQFVYQGGGNLAECIVFGRIAGRHAAAEKPHGDS